MKKLKIGLLVLLASLTFSGCALIPKRVEFGEKKVQAVPTRSPAAQEHLRQAAQVTAAKIDEAQLAAAITKADPTVTAPIAEAKSVSDAVADEVGPPKVQWDGESELLARELNHDHAVLNQKIAKYAAKVQPEVGKKIEGTGWFSVSYFTYVGGILVLVGLAYGALKIYGMTNPSVGLGVNAVTSVASKVVSKGFSELVAGGEAFKQYVEASPLTADVKAYVSSLFVQAHTSNQSVDTQKIVDTLTNKPSGIIAPPLAPVPTTTAPAPSPVIPIASPLVPIAPVPAIPGVPPGSTFIPASNATVN